LQLGRDDSNNASRRHTKIQFAATIENVETEYGLDIKLFLYHLISTVRNKQHGEALVATPKSLTYPQSNKSKIQFSCIACIEPAKC
jgi:hypothetical protein